MNMHSPPVAPGLDQPICIAVLALGGQGGGVLMDWIVNLAEREGWYAQATSVPGVAQRTGATIYYVEMIKPRAGAGYPVLAMMPAPGKVDIVLGSELMEAGRAMQRGLVSPDRTTLIASAHRSYAIQEKSAPADGIADNQKIYDAAQVASKKFIAFDMAAMAEHAGSVISAVLFGALAGSGTLPFSREAYENTIRDAGVGVTGSLRAFDAGFTGAKTAPAAGDMRAAPRERNTLELAPVGHAGFDALVERARTEFPPAAHPLLAAGLQRVVDYQDIAYGREYLDLVATFLPFERGEGAELTAAAAKYIAVAIAYDDVIRVADLKTRGSRFVRVRKEILATDDQVVDTTEFMHPRAEEVIGLLPAALGRRVEANARLVRIVDRLVNKGRRVKTSTLRWFVPLYALGGMRGFRRRTLRHAQEIEHRDKWLAAAREAAAADYGLAVEIVKLRRLVKGYSDTHARGLSKFDKALVATQRLRGRADAADWVRRLREVALADEEGKGLDGAIQTIGAFVD
jgi:indolepyruvate ferredoxin oxidoreductase beta subunit